MSFTSFSSNIAPEQFQNVVSFLTALKSKFVQSNLLLTVSIAISERFDFNRYNLKALSESVDFVIFAQNTKPSGNRLSLDNAKSSISSIEYKIDSLIESGVSAGKIVMGLDLLGFGFTGTSKDNDEDGTFDRMYRYNEVCGLQLSDPRRWRESYADTSLSVLKNSIDNRAIIIESSRSIANKVRLAVKLGLAGVAPTSIAFDEFYGLRSIDSDMFKDFELSDGVNLDFPHRSVRSFPLLNTINEVTRLTLDELKEESKLPSVTPRIRTTTRERTSKTTTATPSDNGGTDLSKVQRVSPEDAKVVCQVYTQTELNAKKIQFDYKTFNWKLCTHVISVEEMFGGMS